MGRDMRQKVVMVTGATGFLGYHVCKKLMLTGKYQVIGVASKSSSLRDKPYGSVNDVEYVCCDLTDREQTRRLLDMTPDVVIHLAARVGGIGANKENPGLFLHDNLVMGVNLIEAASQIVGLHNFIMVGTVCAYPKHTPVPFKEEDIWNGYPEETNAPYGIAKKTLMEMIKAYNAQYDFPGVNLIPVNLYGPRDNFKPESSHVIPALIKKFAEAKEAGEKDVVLWGTGSASREFLHVRDAANGIVSAIDYHNPGPINLGTGKEITIADLAALIKEKVGFEGDIIYDSTKPDGQPRRCLNVDKARHKLGWEAEIPFEIGLEETIAYYYDSCHNIKQG
jgi:GDP-L-fucose synthase